MRLEGPADRPEFGGSVCSIAAFGPRKEPCVIVCAPRERPEGDESRASFAGVARIYNGRGESVARLEGCHHDSADLRAQRIPDLDGDGAADLVLVMPRGFLHSGPTGWIRIVSSAHGEEIARYRPGLVWDFAASLVPIPDIDSDGRPDFLVTNSDVGVQRVSSHTGESVGPEIWSACGAVQVAAVHAFGCGAGQAVDEGGR